MSHTPSESTTQARTTQGPVRSLALGWVLALDAVVLLVFAAVGRRSHDEGNPITGVLETAWPFLVGALVGHLVLLGLRRSAGTVLNGVVVWVCAVAGGMVLRQLTDQGTAPSFIVVATTFTGVFLLGWRALAGLARRR